MTWNKEKDRTRYSYHNHKQLIVKGTRVIRKCNECARTMHHDITPKHLPELFKANLCKICYD